MIGHFSSFSLLTAPLLRNWLAQILLEPRHCSVVLIGFQSSLYLADILNHCPTLEGRLQYRENVSDQEVAAEISACDLMVQPYADGVSTRRSTVMAALALGIAVVTNVGPSTEPVWADTGSVALVSDDSQAAFGGLVNDLLDDIARRDELGRRGAALYAGHFAIEHCVSKLRC